MENFETATHTKELDLMFERPSTEAIQQFENADMFHDFKTQFRFLRKNLSSLLRKRLKKDFKQVLIITVQEPPIDYILAFRKQYPDKDIKVLVPVNNLENLEKTNISFDFFLQNKNNEARLYKFPRNAENVEIFGLYSSAFFTLEDNDFSKLQFLAPFMKAVRICAKKIKPDIIHTDKIPFFLGAEFENKLPYPIRVFQFVDDFYTEENEQIEPFWAAINLVNQQGMKKLCRDKIIQKCIALLFNLHSTKNFKQMRECLDFIYQNYVKFRENINREEELNENILFKRMNSRILKLFPELRFENFSYYDKMYFTLKKTDFWAVISKSYYKEIFENSCMDLKTRINQTKSKSGFVNLGVGEIKTKLYQLFDVGNFRELRQKNKTYLLKEFSAQRVKTKFVDINLLKSEDCEIRGYLDSFYEAPLIFAKFDNDIFKNGVDVALNSILKLFELRKNIQVIVNIPNGLSNNFIKSWVEFLENNFDFNGRWLFIDGKINTAQFYAASDINLLSRRINSSDIEYLSGMKLGCIPVVSRVGILNDTVADIFEDMVLGCGFKTKKSLLNDADAEEDYLAILNKALNLYTNNPASWNLLIKNAMNYDAYWNFKTIEKYNEIYEMM